MKAPNSLTRIPLPTLLKKPLLLLLLLASGALFLSVCQNKPDSLPEKPLYPLFLPEGNSQWLKEIADGFQQSARQFGAEVLIFRYSSPTPEALLKASEGRAPWSVPWCVVFRRKKEIADVVSALSERGIGVITIGADDPGTNRIGHVGDNTQRWTHLWRVRVKQAFPKARKFLFVFGDFPLKDERLIGEILARSQQGTAFEVRFVDLGTFREEDARWCDVVVAVGRDALQFSEKSIPRPVFPVDGDDRTLQGVAEGKFRFLLVPRTFEYGVRAFRLAREYFLQRALEKPVIALEPYEVDATFVEEYKHRRYQLPPVPASVSP
ncbi:MAG: hypothetical protein K6T17_01585 [Fimbriimonadales bacterium]|nr:hypothetical protein [Fimbriimonadales bacterium]